MHVDVVLCHGENGGATWETSSRGCIMRKDISQEVTAGGRFEFFWTLGEPQFMNFNCVIARCQS